MLSTYKIDHFDSVTCSSDHASKVMEGLYSINCYIHSVHGSDSKSVLCCEHTDVLVKGNDDKEVHNTASPSRVARNTADRKEAGSDDSG